MAIHSYVIKSLRSDDFDAIRRFSFDFVAK